MVSLARAGHGLSSRADGPAEHLPERPPPRIPRRLRAGPARPRSSTSPRSASSSTSRSSSTPRACSCGWRSRSSRTSSPTCTSWTRRCPSATSSSSRSASSASASCAARAARSCSSATTWRRSRISAIARSCCNGGKLASEGDAASVVHDYFALMGQAMASAAPARRASPRRREARGPAGSTAMPEAVRRAARGAAARHPRRQAGTRATEIVGFAVSDPDGRPAWTIASGGVAAVLVPDRGARAVDDLNVGIHFYDRRGHPRLRRSAPPTDASSCRASSRPASASCARVRHARARSRASTRCCPRSGASRAAAPRPGLLHDRLESLAARGRDAARGSKA